MNKREWKFQKHIHMYSKWKLQGILKDLSSLDTNIVDRILREGIWVLKPEPKANVAYIQT